MWELEYKESWAPEIWRFWTLVLKKNFERPLDCKEIQQVNPKGNQSWILIGKADVEAKVPILWLPDVKKWIIGEDPDAGKDWRQKEMGMTQNHMVGLHHWLDGREFEKIPVVGDDHGSLVCHSPWGHKKLDTAEQLNWIKQYLATQLYLTLWPIRL